MVRYFQLTPEILLEYVYEGDSKLNVDGNDNQKDLCEDSNSTMLVKSDLFKTKYLFFNPKIEFDTDKKLNSLSNLVLPLNNTETQFVVAKNSHKNFFNKKNVSNKIISNKTPLRKYMYEDTQYDKGTIDKVSECKVKYEKCIIHFTSKNYFENYDSLIFQTYVYMRDKSKLYFASFLFKKTSNVEFKSENLLYNEKLYTTQVEFDIPSVFSIFKKQKSNIVFDNALSSQNIDLMENTPIGITIYGVSGSTTGTDNYEKLKTNKINSIFIPHIYGVGKQDEISVDIYEAPDNEGDYYYIDPNMGSKYSNFVDYIESMGWDIRTYMVMHELCLIEYWVDKNNELQSEITHREYHIIDINEGDEDNEISKRFDTKIKYRPICTKSGNGCVATIIDTIKIINTVDGSSYEVTGSKEISNPHKYGKKLKRLDIKNESRPIVNVYNKKSTITSRSSGSGMESGNSSSGSGYENSGGTSGAIILNKTGGFVVENMTQNITSFIECTNVGVSIVELSPDDIN